MKQSSVIIYNDLSIIYNEIIGGMSAASSQDFKNSMLTEVMLNLYIDVVRNENASHICCLLGIFLVHLKFKII